MNPQPKHKRIKLSKTKWEKLVDELYKRERGICQRCKQWIGREQANPHHIISKGAGGDDSLDNLMLLCFYCHEHKHRGLK